MCIWTDCHGYSMVDRSSSDPCDVIASGCAVPVIRCISGENSMRKISQRKMSLLFVCLFYDFINKMNCLLLLNVCPYLIGDLAQKYDTVATKGRMLEYGYGV